MPIHSDVFLFGNEAVATYEIFFCLGQVLSVINLSKW